LGFPPYFLLILLSYKMEESIAFCAVFGDFPRDSTKV